MLDYKKVEPFFFVPAEPQNEDVEVIEVGDNRIEVDTESEDITISNGAGSIWLTSDELAPLVLALLKLILEKGWHADANL